MPRTKTKKAYEAIELAFEGIGGVDALIAWARENQGDFYKTIFPKIIPVQLNHGDVDGEKLDGFQIVFVKPGEAGPT